MPAVHKKSRYRRSGRTALAIRTPWRILPSYSLSSAVHGFSVGRRKLDYAPPVRTRPKRVPPGDICFCSSSARGKIMSGCGTRKPAFHRYCGHKVGVRIKSIRIESLPIPRHKPYRHLRALRTLPIKERGCRTSLCGSPCYILYIKLLIRTVR